jgi:multisubunit Na+/H+ antiporter MnhG subunit
MLLTALAVVVLCAPYWGDGKLVGGLRAGLEQSQVMDHVSLFSLAQQYAQVREAEGRPDEAFIRSRPSFEILPEATRSSLRYGFSAAFVVATLLIAASVWRGRSPEPAAAETLLLLLLLLTNLYGWYLIPVFGLLALRLDVLGRRYIVAATVLGLVYYPMFIYAHFNTEWSRFQVHLFLAIFLTVPILVYLMARGYSARRKPGRRDAVI